MHSDFIAQTFTILPEETMSLGSTDAVLAASLEALPFACSLNLPTFAIQLNPQLPLKIPLSCAAVLLT